MGILNGNQGREYNRAQALANFFKGQADVYTLYPAYADEVALFLDNNNQLVTFVSAKDVNGEGITGEKRDLKLSTTTLASVICTRVTAYAKKTGNLKLEKAIYRSASEIERLKDADVLGFVIRLISNVTPLFEDALFQNYAVTSDMLDTLTNEATDFNSSIGKAEQANGNRSFASRSINKILKNIRGNITQFNLLLNFFEEDYPAFESGYNKAVAINDSNIRHSGIEGIIKNSFSGEPVQGVSITGEGKNKTTVTGADGAYKLLKLKAGSIPITITAPGYNTQVITVKIMRGRIEELNISLQAGVINLATA